MNKTLVVENLTISFTGKPVVNDVSFFLQKGEVLGIVGESGSGKSMTSLAIMGLVASSAEISACSKVFFQGKNLLEGDLSKNYRGRIITMVFQEPMTSLNPVFTCGQQIEEVLELLGKKNQQEVKQKALKLLEKVKIKDPERTYYKYPHELSGGQKQRIMIAMAIACEPQILIADEPTTALDVTVQKEILELLADIQKETEMSMVFITHDLALVAEIADHVMVMKQGEIVEKNTKKLLFSEPQHPYTRALLACRPSLKKRYRKLLTIDDFLNPNELKREQIEINSIKRKEKHEVIYQQKPILQVSDLKVHYIDQKSWMGKIIKRNKAVDGVNFKLYQGESLGLIGESGCGKTTLGRTIVNLTSKESGSIVYKGKTIHELTKKELLAYRKEVQIIFQDPYASLNPRILVGKAIEEVMSFHGIAKTKKERKESVFALLKKVGLPQESYYLYPHEFSGGQRQRISIARTLALQPKIIICDESVSALDVSIQAQILNLLNQLKEEMNLTYLFISHDLAVVKHFCDRMLVMNKKGKIEEQGESDKIYNSPQSDYTKKLIQSIPGQNKEEQP